MDERGEKDFNTLFRFAHLQKKWGVYSYHRQSRLLQPSSSPRGILSFNRVSFSSPFLWYAISAILSSWAISGFTQWFKEKSRAASQALPPPFLIIPFEMTQLNQVWNNPAAAHQQHVIQLISCPGCEWKAALLLHLTCSQKGDCGRDFCSGTNSSHFLPLPLYVLFLCTPEQRKHNGSRGLWLFWIPAACSISIENDAWLSACWEIWE